MALIITAFAPRPTDPFTSIKARAQNQRPNGAMVGQAQHRPRRADPRPAPSLDAGLRVTVRTDVLAVLPATGTTTVLITHDQDEALSAADQVAVLPPLSTASQTPPHLRQHMLTKRRVSAYADDMEPALQVAEGAVSNDPEVGLRAVAALRALAERLELLQVQQARELGWSWQDIASRLGVPKQTVRRKYVRLTGRR